MENKLYIYNTLSRRKELFETSHQEVGLYCCGPTVYNYAHIGNLRTYVFEDILKRTLLSLGYKVKHVVNITDVGHLTSDDDTGDDKMEMGAKREGKTVWEIAEHYTEKFMENIHDLNILDADIWPKATDHIPDMIDIVKKIEDNGIAYRTEDGIYFDTANFPAYCDFARLDAEALRAGSRVAMGEKKNPTDFALWKFSPKDLKRQMEWDSPWGVGFPGWHIECSAMSLKYLPQPIDIHCGGIDHVRIHHTNEIAQVEGATGEKYVRYWIHGEFLVMDKGKMAKSAGGFITLDTLKERKIAPLAYRLFCFTAHYRSPLNFSWEGIENAANSLRNLRNLVANETYGVKEESPKERVKEILEPFWAAVYDDLNMPKAMAALWDILSNNNYSSVEKKSAVREADKLLDLKLFGAVQIRQKSVKIKVNPGQQRVEIKPSHKKTEMKADHKKVERKVGEPKAVIKPEENLGEIDIRIISSRQIPKELDDEITKIALERKNARDEKNFVEADRLRNKLVVMGVEIRDLPNGSIECVLKE